MTAVAPQVPTSMPSRWAQGIAAFAHIGLIVALPLVAGPSGLIIALPLLLPLPGLWAGRPYTYAWSSLLVVFYVGGFLMEGWAHPRRSTLSFALAALAAIEFCALMFYVRFRAVDRRRAGL
jgi:uncharacterized membrane protein